MNLKGRNINGLSLVAGFAAGLGAGALLGYAVSRRAFARELAEEITSIKAHYRAQADAASARHHAPGRGPSTVGAAGMAPLRTGPYARTEPPDRGDPVEGPSGEHDDGDDEAGEDEEDNPAGLSPAPPVIERGTKTPYVISVGEFFDDNEAYRKITVTYYAGDKVLVDDREVPILDASICGQDFASRFGQESNDESMVYVRNERLQTDFEIVRDGRSYAEVLGYGRPK